MHAAGTPARPRARRRRGSALALAAATAGVLAVAGFSSAMAAAPRDVAQAQLLAASTGPALFTTSGLVPGRPVSRCIDVTLPGEDPSASVLVRALGVAGPLADDLALTVAAGPATGATPGDCTGFVGSVLYTGTLADLASTSAGAPYGASTGWYPGRDGDTRAFRFTVQVADTDAAQAQTAVADLVWSVLSTDPDPGPTAPPTADPTDPATGSPGEEPTSAPDGDANDDPGPTRGPSGQPTAEPSTEPSDQPTAGPSIGPGGGEPGDGTGGILRPVSDPLAQLGRTLAATLRHSGFPMALGGIVLFFLLVQDQLDRRDPKLALSPLTEQPQLPFGPVVAG